MAMARRAHCYRAPAQGADAGGLGVAVQILAQYRGLSLNALAGAAQPRSEPGSAPNWIYRIADGTNAQIKTAVLVRLCRALSCDPDALLRLAGLWPAQGAGGRGQGAENGQEREAALLDLRLGEAEDVIALWPDGERSAVLRVLESLVPLAVPEEPVQAYPERARGA